jgi:UDP-glucose 4-epimerase
MTSFGDVFITGGAGFIGSHLAELCLQQGHRVRCYDNLSVGMRENVPAGAELIVGDIMDAATMLDAMRGSEYIFHLAARVSIRRAVEQFIDDADVNIIGTLNALKAARDAGARRFVYASSMAVYGNPDYSPQDEKHPTRPTSPYGVSKLASEHYVRQLGNLWGLEANSCRFFNTYGTRQTPSPYVGVITIFCRQLFNGETPTIFGDGEQVRDFIHVSDIANGAYLAATGGAYGDVFNLGTGIGTSVNDIGELLSERINPSIKAKHGPAQPGEPGDSIADISHSREVIGFEPKWKIGEKINEVIEWNKPRR